MSPDPMLRKGHAPLLVMAMALSWLSGGSAYLSGLVTPRTSVPRAGFLSSAKPHLRTLAASSSPLLLRSLRRGASLGLKMKQTVQDGDVVGVHYRGTLDNGDVFDQNIGGPLLEFEVGSGRVIKGFDEAVRGLAVGESRTVRCAPKDAYGEYDEANVAEVPLDRMPDPPPGMKMEPGLVLQLNTGQIAVIKEIKNNMVTLDGNHPLAGKTLNFNVTLGMIMDRTIALQAKVAEMEAILSNPLMALVASDVTKDQDYIPNLKKKLSQASDKGAFIREILASEEWRSINVALMSNPELLKLVQNPEALEKMVQGKAKAPAEDGPSNVLEAEFQEDA